jgi:anti-sigma B factor antagonist
MKIHDSGDILTVTNIKELAAGNAEAFRDEVRGALASDIKAIEIDLSDTDFIDSCGLGALISLYKSVNDGNETVPVRLLNPTSSVQQLFELTRLHRVFEIVKTETHVAAHP